MVPRDGENHDNRSRLSNITLISFNVYGKKMRVTNGSLLITQREINILFQPFGMTYLGITNIIIFAHLCKLTLINFPP